MKTGVIRVDLLIVVALSGGAAGCGSHRSGATEQPLATRVEESSRYGEDRVIGVLHVSATEAYLEHADRRLRMVGAPPMTAVSLEALLAPRPASSDGWTASRCAPWANYKETSCGEPR
jgi:hypothetical protein